MFTKEINENSYFVSFLDRLSKTIEGDDCCESIVKAATTGHIELAKLLLTRKEPFTDPWFIIFNEIKSYSEATKNTEFLDFYKAFILQRSKEKALKRMEMKREQQQEVFDSIGVD